MDSAKTIARIMLVRMSLSGFGVAPHRFQGLATDDTNADAGADRTETDCQACRESLHSYNVHLYSPYGLRIQE